MDLNLKPKTIQSLNFWNRGNFCDFELGKIFLDMTSKGESTQ